MPRLALATAITAAARDEDLAPLMDACARAGIDTVARAWDDPTVAWARFDAVLLRSTWDYTARLDAFLSWCARVSSCTQLINPLPVVRWNTDKRYLTDLAARGVPVVPTVFVAPDEEPLPALQAFLAAHAQTAEYVVKPTVGAGSHGAQRFSRAHEFAAANHLAELLQAGRGAMLQPYLDAVDRDGETALVYLDGTYSHAICKSARLAAHGDAPEEAISAREPRDDEHALAVRALQAAVHTLGLDGPLAYARVDLLRDNAGQPRVLELELCEPSLFLSHAPDGCERLAGLLAQRLA